jgi:hypothetical protein
MRHEKVHNGAERFALHSASMPRAQSFNLPSTSDAVVPAIIGKQLIGDLQDGAERAEVCTDANDTSKILKIYKIPTGCPCRPHSYAR